MVSSQQLEVPARVPRARPSATAARGVALVVAVLLAAGVWLVQYGAVQTAAGQRLDDGLLDGIDAVTGEGVDRLASLVSGVGLDVAIILALVLALTALVRVRPDQLVLLAVVVGGANATTQVLKHVLIERPALVESTTNTLPSGHVTLVTSVALALTLMSYGWASRALVVLGTAAALFMGSAVVIAGWHRPSDSVAAWLVCGCFAALAVAVVGPGEQTSRWA